jgi:hypothetical protein
MKSFITAQKEMNDLRLFLQARRIHPNDNDEVRLFELEEPDF